MQNQKSKEREVILKLLLAVILWGGSFIATKIALREMAPLALVWLRFGMGVIILGAVTLQRRQFSLPSRPEIPSLLVLGLIGIAFHQWLQSTGLVTSRASTSAWIVASIPVFTALLGWLILRERLNLIQVGGMLLAAAGVALVVSNGSGISRALSMDIQPGDVLILVSAPNWALFSVLSRRILRKRPPAWSMLYVMLAGWLAISLWLVLDSRITLALPVTLEGWTALLFLGILCSGLAYVFYYDALDALPAARTAVFVNIEPLVTVVASFFLLQEAIGWPSVVGGAVIILGVRLVQQTQARPSGA